MRYTIATAIALASVVGLLPFGAAAKVVNCNSPNASIQDAVDGATGPTTIFIQGDCVEDVTLTKDDITLSGNRTGAACDKADPGASAGATIDGTITVDGVRASIEFLTITGSGGGVTIINRADVRLTCNDISNNEAEGVAVLRSSNAVLRDNTLSGNGTRTADPFIFFDCGLFAVDASSVFSVGNTYKDNQYCAIEIDRQSAFRNGAFLPREPGGGPADPNERDVYTEKGCDPGLGTGCFTTDQSPIAIEAFNDGLVDLRNFEVNGEITVIADSSFRLEADGTMQGNISNEIGSLVRIRDRFTQFGGDRSISFTGQLSCFDTSQTYFANVQCTQICTGLPSLGNCRFPECNDTIDNEGVPDGNIDFPADPECADLNDDDESS
ncbi:MAG: right-handed parallel beta-helix repeat-containing protein [Proteobacteria bacterium]|nr:right-handed parallel beta-helix repeat-containing protein [Pseudomonadota bacterium]